ncbi:response regulator [Ghiorsea bivora]|uniref:response regulator n=1 Tax=Ghiorsea bivora TaxID=1485545 RepID=UPI00056FD03D|nr:response regulator [Ghiorsea bivora]
MSAQARLKTVLVVDDNPTLVELFAEVLNELFYVKVANSAVEAITKLSSDSIDAVVCDYHLGTQNAEVVIDWINEQQPRLAKKIILLTGEIGLDPNFSKNNFSVLYKPVEMEELLIAVESLFERNQGLME